jgi:hypothetical protein
MGAGTVAMGGGNQEIMAHFLTRARDISVLQNTWIGYGLMRLLIIEDHCAFPGVK